jgi:hypothetical protein
MKRGRYIVDDVWTTIETQYIDTYNGDTITVTTDLADVTDTRGGYKYDDGARRVTVKMKGRGKRSRVFIGEMAWADGRRWADDVVYDLQK